MGGGTWEKGRGEFEVVSLKSLLAVGASRSEGHQEGLELSESMMSQCPGQN